MLDKLIYPSIITRRGAKRKWTSFSAVRGKSLLSCFCQEIHSWQFSGALDWTQKTHNSSPTKSPDLTTLDLFLWENYVKEMYLSVSCWPQTSSEMSGKYFSRDLTFILRRLMGTILKICNFTDSYINLIFGRKFDPSLYLSDAFSRTAWWW